MTTMTLVSCPRCRTGVMLPGEDAGETSCLSCGHYEFEDAVSPELAGDEVALLERVREGKFFFGREGQGGVRASS